MDSFYIFQLFAVIAIVFYLYLIRPYDYWKRQGLKTVPGIIPGFGNVLPVLMLRENISSVCNRLYQKYCINESMIGMFFMRTPMLIIRDPDLIKSVLIKDFQCFQNNMIHLDKDRDAFMSKNPFFAVDDTWKQYRKKLVSNMSQKKLKTLFRIMHRVSLKFMDYLDLISDETNVVELELKSVCTKFTGELVANTAFGIEGYSFETNPDPRSFTVIVEKLLEPTMASGLRQTISLYLPGLAAFLGVSFMPKAMTNFLKNTVNSILQQRKKEGIVTEDFLQMTVEDMNKMDVDVIAGHVSSYFFNAYETSATVAAFACYQLSQNPSVQEKARQEIKSVLMKNDGTLHYESLKEMTYLDQILNETIRLHPILGVTLRVCTQDVTIEASNGQTCFIKRGHLLCIPVQSIHTDKDFWKDPNVFDPDRFSNERYDEIVKFAYLPFSEGPRVCPGLRYGIMTVKTILVTILSEYNLELSNRTKTPLKYDQMNFLTEAAGGLWLKMKRINDKE